MADRSVIHDECLDDMDEGVFEQGDGGSGGSTDDETLPPLLRIQKYAQSGNMFDRQMVSRVTQDLFKTASAESLAEDLHEIMKLISKLAEEDEPGVRIDLIEQIPYMAAQAIDCTVRVPPLKLIVGEYLLPLVVRHLGCSDNAVDKAAHSTVINLLEQGLISCQQAEIQVCPTVLALSKVESMSDLNTGIITLMSRMAPLLGKDVTERVFLRRFAQLCSSPLFYVRRVCASLFGDFCAVVGKDAYGKILLPCYVELCKDDVWGVRKSCAEVIMFVSCASTALSRHDTLAPIFSNLLQDECRWVKMSAFQTLGPFIATFASPAATNMSYNNMRELILVNEKGNEYLMNSFSRIVQKSYENIIWNVDKEEADMLLPGSNRYVSLLTDFNKMSNTDNNDVDVIMNPLNNLFGLESDLEKAETNLSEDIFQLELSNEPLGESIAENVDASSISDPETSEEDIKEIVESVKNAVLSYRNVDQKTETVYDKSSSNANVISDSSITCDNLDSVKKLNLDVNNINLVQVGDGDSLAPDFNSNLNLHCTSNITYPENGDENTEQNQVITNKQNDVDNLRTFNSYNFWYVSPELPLDPKIIDDGQTSKNKIDDSQNGVLLDQFNSILMANGSGEPESSPENKINLEKTMVKKAAQDIIPQALVDHFISMTDPMLATTIDNEMAFHCAYSLPAVVLTLGRNNWSLLKNTVESLAADMQYKVRRTVASSLHELALILGTEGATIYLTPLFDGFLKDLDEVRIGILKHLAHFLKLISPMKRSSYLPKLSRFLLTDNQWNWRFRQELAIQLLEAVPLFKPSDIAKYMTPMAEELLCDPVCAVRQDAVFLTCELVRCISTEPGLTPLLLVQLAEKFAHSTKWKRRQTFALLCAGLLSSNAITNAQFASELMPHLLDLSWDPVANVRLVAARTIANHIVTKEYFLDLNNQHYEGLESVMRRLQADKDRDVRQSAETEVIFSKM